MLFSFDIYHKIELSCDFLDTNDALLDTHMARKTVLPKVFIVLSFMLGITCAGSCVMMGTNNHKSHPLHDRFSRLQHDLPPLDFTQPPVITPAMQSYHAFYHLDFPEVEHRWGSFQSGEYTLAAHIFTPQEPKGTVFLLHGYLDHTGILYRVIQNCLKQQFVVAIYDLPGHGLSSGERADISDFSAYVSVFHDFLGLCRPHVPTPYHVLSHSTGSAIVFEYLAATPEPFFDKIIFLAPLVHHVHWRTSKIAFTLCKLVQIDALPRRYSQKDLDPALIDFIKTDPLQTDRVPMTWVEALYKWNKKIQKTEEMTLSALIIQGKEDDVVDWEYNMPFLQKKFPQASIKVIDEAGHYLINESSEIQAEIFQTVNAYLKDRSQEEFP